MLQRLLGCRVKPGDDKNVDGRDKPGHDEREGIEPISAGRYGGGA
jgi:hypothetical protein